MYKRISTIFVAVSLMTASLSGKEERPKVGLVLGGGGALGFAHVGVLQELEKLQIPIDYIGGTSMGAIVAGMYAAGISPDEIEAQFLEMNWWEVLKDQSQHQFLDYRRKLDDKRFMGMEFGLNDWQVSFSPGVSYGQKLNNVLETFAINSVGITDFDKLNIPYRAVATDLRSGTSVVLDSGNLAKAMRASMAVPGAFTPVRMGDMVLVDGGILNNIPVQVVKDMGADIIIAVDVGATSADASANSEFRSLGSVIGRTYSLMQRPDQVAQLAMADVVIAPDLTGSSASHFHKADNIIPAGRLATEQLRDQLKPLAVDESTFEDFLKKQRLLHTDELLISDIKVAGNERVSTSVIEDRIKAEKGPINLDVVRDDLSRIHGMGDFQTVTYQLQPAEEGYGLDYQTIEKFWGPGYLHFGLKIEATSNAQAYWSVLLNYTRTHLNALGGEMMIDLELGGQKRHIFGEWYQPISWGEHVFLAPSATLSSEDINLYIGDDDVADIEQQFAYAGLDTGISFFEYGELRIGALGGSARVEGQSGFIGLPEINDTVVSATTRLRLDQLNHPVFPTRGYRVNFDGMFAFEEMGSSESFNKVELEALVPFSAGRHTVTPRLSAGSSLQTDLPFYALFDVGGLTSFAGMAPYQLRGNYYGVGSLDYRFLLTQLSPTFGNGVYALLRGDAGNAWFDPDSVGLDNLEYGVLAGVGADTIFGACILAVGKAESLQTRFYFSIGNSF
jgi:NTE family protein